MNTQNNRIRVLAVFALALTAAWPLAAQQPASGSPGVIMLPPDFYHNQREALKINEDQLREIQRIAEKVTKEAEGLQAEMRKRTEGLHEVLGKHPANPEEAARRLHSVLEIEGELKTLQLCAKLAMRNVLNAEQYERLQQLVKQQQKDKGNTASAGLKERFEQLKQEIKRRTGGGEPPRELIERLEQIERAARDGRVDEAGQQVDALLRQLRSEGGGKESGQMGKDGVRQQMQKLEEALKKTENPEQRERIEQQMRRLRESREGGKGPEGAPRQ